MVRRGLTPCPLCGAVWTCPLAYHLSSFHEHLVCYRGFSGPERSRHGYTCCCGYFSPDTGGMDRHLMSQPDLFDHFTQSVLLNGAIPPAFPLPPF